MKKSRLLFQHRICRGIATREYIPGKRVYAKSVSRVRISVAPLKLNPASRIACGIFAINRNDTTDIIYYRRM